MHWVDVLPLWITGALGFAAFLYVQHHGGHGAMGELERANKVLTERLRELALEARQQAQIIGALEQRTNLEPIAAAVVEQFAFHEARAQQRHERELILLDLIAQRMGRDAEAA